MVEAHDEPQAFHPPRPHVLPRLQVGHWWLAVGLWTLLIGLGTAWLIDHDLRDTRAEQLSLAEQRLNTLHNALTLSFQQLGALPKALSRQAPSRATCKTPTLPTARSSHRASVPLCATPPPASKRCAP